MRHFVCLVLAWMTTPTFARAEVADRLSQFPTGDLPLRGKLDIAWDAHLIPFVTAEHDEDVPFALGLVHAHLRLAQLELMRYISQGRLSEIAGPFTTDIDHTIRIFDPGRARHEILAKMPPKSRAWAERFVEGLNLYIDRNPKQIPPDLVTMGISKIPKWTLEDLITAWRLTAFDINWAPYLYYLKMKAGDRDRVWNLALEAGLQSIPSFTKPDDTLGRMIFNFSEIGSNSMVFGRTKTKSGSGLIMNDPHLGLTIPNTWLIAGLESPSYHAVGFMLPSLPFFALGRNPKLAWGGTNMWGLSTFLYELDDAQEKAASVRTEKIKVRGWLDRKIKIRTTPIGPIISDSPWVKWTGRPVAVKWVGHEATDELTAFLGVNRAQNVDEFRRAFATYGVSAMNMLAADVKGNVAHVLAYRRPVRPDPRNTKAIQPLSNLWTKTTPSTELPFAKNPKEGFLASANNRPFAGAPDVGFFFQSNDRIRRMQALGREARAVDVAQAKVWQMDTLSPSAVEMRDVLAAKVSAGSTARALARDENWKAILGWNGRYDADSRGAAAFEILLFDLAPRMLERVGLSKDAIKAVLKSPNANTVVLGQLRTLAPKEATPLVQRILTGARENFRRYPKWQDMHRVQAAHVLGKIPLLGSRWRFDEFGIGGGADTLFKTSAPRANDRATAVYGSNARQISDLESPDENYFVLFGGQDGWMGSPHALDQIGLWRRGEYVRLPLGPKARAKVFTRTLELKARGL